MLSTKCAKLSYPTHFLKSRGSVIRNNFLEYRTNKGTQFVQRNDLYALLAINKAKHILNRPFSCSCSDNNLWQMFKEKLKRVQFLKVYHFSIGQHFSNVKVVVVQAVIA